MEHKDPSAGSSRNGITNHWADSLWFRLLLIVAIGLGIFFRFSGLGNKLYSHDETYTSLDSAGYVGGEVFASLWDSSDKTARDLQKFLQPAQDRGILHTLSIVARFEPHEAPIYFLLTHIWMRTIGYTPAAMRALAALFSLLSIPAIYWLGKELFRSSRTALLAAALLALSPYQIIFAQDARPYSLWTLVTILSSAALLRALRKNTLVAWLGYFLTLVLGMYSHQLFALVAIVHALYVLGRRLMRSHREHMGFISAALVAFLAFIPWIVVLISGWNHVARRMEWANIQIPWYRYIQRWMVNFSSPFLDLDFGASNLIPYALRALMLLLIAWSLFFLLRNGSSQQKKFLLLLYILPIGVFMLADVVLGGIRSIGGRYFVPASVAAVLIMAYFLGTNLERSSSAKWIGLTVLVMLACVVSNVNSLQSETWWNKELGRVRPEFVHTINQDGTLLIVSGRSPTNLGDVLPLGFRVDADVRFRLHEDPYQVEYTSDRQNIYWFPGSYEQAQEVAQQEGLQASEVLPGILWRIEAGE